MKTNELINIIENADENFGNEFITNTETTFKLATNSESVEIDYSWLVEIEECIQDLDQIVRNPRKFIIQEEEVVPVEKAKKISMETVKHLAQHTNLIQDVSSDGMITPSAVLNINKEESYDIYENRFINSLLKNLYIFIQDMKKNTGSGRESYSKSNRKLEFLAETKLKNEKIKIQLNMETDYYENLIASNTTGLSLSSRIERVELIISDFMKSAFIKELSNALPVRSPIRKTNVILKNQNFKKALELWEYIEKYRVVEPKQLKENSKIEKNKKIEEKFDLTYYLNYAILSSLNNSNKHATPKIDKSYIKKIIENYVNDTTNPNSNTFQKFVAEEYDNAVNKKIERQNTIVNLLKESIKEYDSAIKDCMNLLK